MSQSKPSTRRNAAPRQRRGTETEPAVVEGIQMPSLSALPNFNIPLYNAASEYYLSLDENVIQPQRAKQHDKMIEAQKRGAVPTMHITSLPDWTLELEQRAKQKLDATKTDWSFPKGMHSEYLSLTKTSMMYARCSPRDIVGVRTRLCFDLDARAKSQDTTPPHPFRFWTKTFCDKLGQLITHQAWSSGQTGGRASSLATAIQYAVILRTKDEREWDMCFTDPFLDAIQNGIKRGMSAREAHAKARENLLRSGDLLNAYHISNVLKALEETVEERPESIASDSFYCVVTEDLAALTRALDGMTDPDTGCVNLSTAMFHKMALAIRPNRGTYPTGEELASVHEQVMLEECRRLLHREYLHGTTSRNGRGSSAADQVMSDRGSPRSTSRNDIDNDADPAVMDMTFSEFGSDWSGFSDDSVIEVPALPKLES